jgi:SAM-dependent methyltransferase
MLEPYDQSFFEAQSLQAQRSAREVVPLVMELVHPRSVVDVGCGGGAWLSVFKEHGVRDVLGVDGPWATKHWKISPAEFVEHDLTQPLQLGRKFDLVMCLEVAEHLPQESARGFVGSLAALGETILFSAAVPLQGGTSHVNEQWPDYWAALFKELGYAPVDCLRRRIWDNEKVDWWYAQNALFFLNPESSPAPHLRALLGESATSLPLRAVHPRNYLVKARRANIGLAEVLKMTPPLLVEAVARRLRKLVRE